MSDRTALALALAHGRRKKELQPDKVGNKQLMRDGDSAGGGDKVWI